jgi:hypothetical protein
MIGRRVEDFAAPIGTLAELRVQTQRAWDEIPQAEIDHLILSMPQRLNECIRLIPRIFIFLTSFLIVITYRFF